jgi:hypothetical protein
MALTTKQLSLLNDRVVVDNPDVRQALVDQIKIMQGLDDDRKTYATAKRKFDSIIGEYAVGPDEHKDILIGEGWVVRLDGSHREGRRASEPRDLVRKTIWRTESGVEA